MLESTVISVAEVLESNQEKNRNCCHESTIAKIAKYRNFCIIPVVNTFLTATKTPLIEAKILNVREKKMFGELLKILPPLNSDYNHLKRINGGQMLIEIADKNSIVNYDAKLKQILKEEPEICLLKVPRYRPRSQIQYDVSRKYWPVSFHKDVSLDAKLNGTFFTAMETKNISKIFMRTEMNGAIFYDSEKDLIICEGTSNPKAKSKSTLCHPVMECIRILSEQQQLRSSQDNKQYLATGFDAILAKEPCTMCAMAMVHCRVKRVFFGNANGRFGSLLSRWRLQDSSSLNHHIEVYKIVEIL